MRERVDDLLAEIGGRGELALECPVQLVIEDFRLRTETREAGPVDESIRAKTP